MTETNGNGEIGCTEEVLEGIDQESATATSAPAEAAAAGAPNFPMRFNIRGPGKLRKIPRTVRRTSDGFDVEVEWEYPWAPGLRQAGHSIEEVAEFVERVLNDSKGWVRAGIWFPRVPLEQAQGVVRYVPPGQTRCNQRTPGAVGCASRGFLPGGRDLVELTAPRFGHHKGLLHELAHAFAGAKHNRGTPYSGIMGNSPPGIWPTDNDVRSVRAWLGGGH
jgi:hypothetical protein